MTSLQRDQTLRSAVALHRAGRTAEAAALYARIRAAWPGDFDVANLGGLIELQAGRAEEAAAFFARARRIDARSPAAAFHHGVALARIGRLAEAKAAFEAALALQPAHAEARERLGALLVGTDGHAAAEPHFRKLVELQPRRPAAWSNLGICLLYLGRISESLAAFGRALEIDPAFDHANAGTGLALEKCFRVGPAIEAYERALAANPANHQARSARLVALQYLGNRTPEEMAEEHRSFGRMLPAPGPRTVPGRDDPDRPLRVGFLSPDLHRHSVSFFIEPILGHLDRAQFGIFLYHDQPVVDPVSERLRALADDWKVVAGLSDPALESVVRRDRIDILFDLAGHTGGNRLPLFARRLAPIQATYLGYPDTTGVPAIDYRLVDELTDPPGRSDLCCTETLVRFAPTAWSYSPPAEAPVPSVKSAGLRSGPVFGSFNNFAKVTDATLGVWARLLRAVPGSRLLLKGHGLTAPSLQIDLRRRLARAGADLTTIDFLERTRTIAEHLAAYDRVDVALDTYPYHGTTTTCEALWMGVPVVSLLGDRHASRVGASLLHAVGHPGWIAADWDEYIAKAAALALDPAARAALRASLRDEMRASALLDHRAQAARFGAALRGVWRNLCRTGAAEKDGVAA